MWAREAGLRHVQRAVEDPSVRDNIARVSRGPFEEAAKLPPEVLRVAFDLAESAVDAFAKRLLGILTSQGTSLRVDRNHAVRFILTAEIIEDEDEEVIFSQEINRGGRLAFSSRWGSWLYDYGERKDPGAL